MEGGQLTKKSRVVKGPYFRRSMTWRFTPPLSGANRRTSHCDIAASPSLLGWKSLSCAELPLMRGHTITPSTSAAYSSRTSHACIGQGCALAQKSCTHGRSKGQPVVGLNAEAAL